jgi:hypothetical protein
MADIGSWLGAIPNAIGKFMYDAGIPDPMADQYAKKQAFDLNKKHKDAIIKQQELENSWAEALSGIQPKADKNGNLMFMPGFAGEIQKKLFVDKMPVHEVLKQYGPAITMAGKVPVDRVQFGMLNPEQQQQSSRMKYGLEMNAKQKADHGLAVSKFQHSAFMDNATKGMDVYAGLLDNGASKEVADAFMTNFALGLKTAGVPDKLIEAAIIPMGAVQGRKDIDLASKLMLRNTQAYLASVRAANVGAGKNGKGKNADPSKIKLDQDGLAKQSELNGYKKILADKEATAEDKAAAKFKLEEYDQLKGARLQRFRQNPAFYTKMKQNGYDDDFIDDKLRQQSTNRSLYQEPAYDDEEDD